MFLKIVYNRINYFPLLIIWRYRNLYCLEKFFIQVWNGGAYFVFS